MQINIKDKNKSAVKKVDAEVDPSDFEEKKEKKTPKGPGVSDSENDGHGADVVPTSDYKINAAGKKYRAHRIVFNKGEDDGTKGVSEQMKKTYKQFVEQHSQEVELTEEQLDEMISEVLSKDAVAGEWIHDFVHSDDPKFAGKSKEKRKQMALAAYYAKQRNEGVDLEEGWDDMLKSVKKAHDAKADATKTRTATAHDVKKTSTGTVYTKQTDDQGMSKEFKRDPNAAKRGRGRPKKNAFAEAVEFLIALDEETFDSLMEEGFDSFMEQYEQLDELSKTTLASYAKHAAVDAKFKGFDAGSQQGHAMARSKELFGGVDAGKETDDKAHKRLSGVKKAIDRLVK